MTCGMPSRSRVSGAMLVLAVVVTAALRATPARAQDAGREAEPLPERVRFNRDIRPVLSDACLKCHGFDEKERKADLRLDTKEGLTRVHGGVTPVVAGDAAKSEVYRRITTHDADDVMPPAASGKTLTSRQKALVKRWIEQGAEYEPHWSFTPVARPGVPKVADAAWVRNPVDAFVLARLEAAGLKPMPPADQVTLIRRATLDLTGLPPTPAEVDAFVADAAPDAYEKLVDRLLASRRFGERWARPWLDLARYADSKGYGSDPLRLTIHRYRDWVIDAFNANKPFDQFTIEQIAGDLLPDPAKPAPTQDQLIATAFHRNTMTNTEGGTDDEEFRVAAVKDRADVTIQAWMGLTMGCAQCHTHKFDPITHREYYSLYAIFNQTEDADRGDESPTIPTPGKDQQEQKAKLEAQIVAAEEEIKKSAALAAAQAKWEASLTDPEAGWTVLDVVEAKSRGGATLDVRPDGSVVATGERAKTDVYTVVARTDLRKITGLRIEALPDESLPDKGPGRSGNGNFVLNELKVVASPLKEQSTQPRLTGRYVRVQQPGKKAYLALAEVQVLDGSENLAKGGKAKQSSTGFGGAAERAIDGNTAGGDYYKDNTVAHTAKEDDPWWELDLGAAKTFDRVAVWNRTDAVADRLAGFKVSVLDEKRQTVWSETVEKAPKPSVTLGPGKTMDVALTNASATYEQPDAGGWTAAKAVDGDPKANSGWAVGGKPGQRHVAAFETAAPVGLKDGTRLTFRLVQNFETGSLGRFRLSATTKPKPVRVLPTTVSEAIAVAAEKRTDAQRALVRDHFLTTTPESREVFGKVYDLRKQLAAIKVPQTAIMRELPADKRRPSHILVKGNFLQKGDPVEPGVLGAFHSLPAGAANDRLGLAGWLVSKENPLTARVQVNRIWAQFFGTGLVETQEDFGEQGQPPSHPELLDWLAVEFMEPTVGGSPAGGGGTAWDTKRLMRLIVTSATYRQSAKVLPEHVERDARNRLLARMPRQRLEAEMVRDQALAVSGLLSGKMFGPSVYPPQPDGMWQAAFNGERTYPTSTGEDRYRRGLYVFWRRTVPYPSMQTFDAPSREVCTIRRISTSTPLQAFVTMNDPVYVECSQALGRRLVKEGGDSVEARVRFGLRLVLQRPPTEEQVEPLVKLYAAELAHFRDDAEDAKKLATQPIGPLADGQNVAEVAAWTVVANVLLNLDAAMTR